MRNTFKTIRFPPLFQKSGLLKDVILVCHEAEKKSQQLSHESECSLLRQSKLPNCVTLTVLLSE